MKLQLIAVALGVAFSAVGFAQSASDSSTSGSSGSSYGSGSTPSSSCDSMSGAERTQCLRDQAAGANSRPSEVPASTGAGTSTDSRNPSDTSSSSGGTSDSSTSSSPSTDDTSKPKD